MTARPKTLFAMFIACALLPAVAAADAAGPVRVEVLVGGQMSPEYHRGDTAYVLAHRGKEYSIRLSNDSGQRVAVALAVDGLNTIDAKHTGPREAAKWVLGPWESIEVTGWQVSGRDARRFVFTTEERSYGKWVGDTRNLGVVEAVVYGEKLGCCFDPAPVTGGFDDRETLGDAGGRRDRSSGETRRSESPRSAEAEAPAASADVRSGALQRKPSPHSAPRDDYAATGTGRKVRNPVEWVAFELDSAPLGSARVRYGYRDELVELGVLPSRDRYRRLEERERAEGFAPDPGQGCCR